MSEVDLYVGDKCIVEHVNPYFNDRVAVVVKITHEGNGSKSRTYGIHIEDHDYGRDTWDCFARTGEHSNWHNAVVGRLSGYLSIRPYKKQKCGLTKFLEGKCK